MDPNPSLPVTHRGGETVNVTRYLPTYEEANFSYSFRLPTYRSSYVRRYHPYARYTVSPTLDHSIDDESDIDGEEPLDLSTLVPMMPVPALPALNDEEIGGLLGAHEAPAEGQHEEPRLAIVDPDHQDIIIDDRNGHQNEDGLRNEDATQQSHFYKIDMVQSFAALCCP